VGVYKRINWEYEPVDKNKLNDMVGNDDWIYQNMVTGYYDVYGVVRDSGLELRSGYVKGINTEAVSFFVSLYYGRPFLPGARPVVTTGVTSGNAMNYIVGVRGLDNRAIPDHRGLLCHFTQLRDPGGPTKFAGGDQWVGIIAIAPRS
jgi:hypothetical protein